jgi:hypothetical protein
MRSDLSYDSRSLGVTLHSTICSPDTQTWHLLEMDGYISRELYSEYHIGLLWSLGSEFSGFSINLSVILTLRSQVV